MDRLGIDEAVCWHSAAEETHPWVGNRLLLEAVADQPRLHPCVVLLPPGTGEFDPPDEHIRELKSQGAVAARMAPYAHGYDFDAFTCGPVLEALHYHGMPLYVDTGQYSNFPALRELLGTFRDLTFIFCNTGYRDSRSIYPILREFENVHLDISRWELHNGLEHLLGHFHPERFLFGTGWPVFTPASAMTMLSCAQISDGHKAKIAAKNLDRLLAGVR
ncbi:MAG: amidohydrolase family protein, partial [Armatimonadota bacterium]